MAGLILWLALALAACDTSALLVSQSGPPDMEAIYREHAEWVANHIEDEDWDAELYEYWIKDPQWAIGDASLYATFEATRSCVLENFPQVVEDGVYVPTLFFEVMWLVYEEGWFLNEVTHRGVQIAGVVWAGHIIGLDDEMVEDGETIVHEIIHVFVPSLGHSDLYMDMLKMCKPIVWPEEPTREFPDMRGRWWDNDGNRGGRLPWYDVRNP